MFHDKVINSCEKVSILITLLYFFFLSGLWLFTEGSPRNIWSRSCKCINKYSMLVLTNLALYIISGGPYKRPVQTLATLLGPTCCERLHTTLCVVGCCCDLLEVVGWSLKLVKLQSQQVPTFLLFHGHRSVVQQCCVRLHSTSNNVGARALHAKVSTPIHANKK